MHFHHKLDLFGFDCLVRPISIHDLRDDDIEAFSAGAMQILPIKDKAGRTVCCNFHKYHNFQSSYNQIRLTWYAIMQTLENDESIQKKGVVNIIYNVDNDQDEDRFHYTKKDLELMVDASFINDCLPFRYASMHFCYNNPRLKPLMNVIHYAVGTEARIRFRAHYGKRFYGLLSVVTFLFFVHRVEGKSHSLL